ASHNLTAGRPKMMRDALILPGRRKSAQAVEDLGEPPKNDPGRWNLRRLKRFGGGAPKNWTAHSDSVQAAGKRARPPQSSGPRTVLGGGVEELLEAFWFCRER